MIDQIHYSALLHRSKKHLKNIPEYQRCLDSLAKDPKISAQLGKLVGTTFEQRRLESEDVIFGCINAMLKTNRSDVFEIEVFKDEYSKIEKFIYTDEIEYYDLIPLFGFSADDNPICLANGLEIVKFSEDEILSILNSGLIVGPPVLGGDHLSGTATFGIKRKFKLPKIIGEKEQKAVLSKIKKKGEKIYNLNVVIDLMRVFKKGEFYKMGIMRGNDSFLGLGRSISNYPTDCQVMIIDNYHLDKKEIQDCKTLIIQNEKLYKNEKIFLRIANRRFSQAIERKRLDDKILDFLICAEALFLGSGPDGGNNSELKYRLSHNAAMVLETKDNRRRKLFEFMGNAYNIRSKIIHGSKLNKMPKNSNRTPYRIDIFIDELETILRAGIKKAVSYLHTNKKTTIDWKNIVFPNGNQE